MNIEIRSIPGFGDHVVVIDAHPTFVAPNRDRAERFVKHHVASRLVMRGLDDLADAVLRGEVEATEATKELGP